MRKKLCRLGLLTLPVVLAVAGSAQAQTLGIASAPSGSTSESCFGAVIAQFTDDSTTPYMVPSPGGEITQWQTNTSGATAGAPVEFVVLRPSGGNQYTVVGTDSESLPNPLPSDNVASYPLATPISVLGGETVGLWTGSSDGAVCYWTGGSTPSGDGLMALNGPPTTGQTETDEGTSGSGFTMNLAYNLSPAVIDAGVTASASPTAVAPGQYGLLASTVSNSGPGTGKVSFTDTVPAGLAVKSAFAGSGSCATSGQKVSCTTGVLSPGSSVPVNIVVTASTPGNFVNTASVTVESGASDPNSANNTASAALTVTAPAPRRCTVPHVKGAPAGVARSSLHSLGCRWRAVKAHSTRFKKNHVIRSQPGAGVYAYGRKVTLVVSSGPKKVKKHHAVRREIRWP